MFGIRLWGRDDRARGASQSGHIGQDGQVGHAGHRASSDKPKALRSRRTSSGVIRRWLLRLGLLGAILAIAQWRFPVETDATWWRIRQAATEVGYQKELRYAGLGRLRAEDLEVLLPTARPIWWWWASGPAIEEALLANPLVEHAAVMRCVWYAARCFQITVRERAPTALISLNGTWWLVGADGGIIGPISEQGRAQSRLPLITGLDRFSDTPQVLRERLSAILSLMRALQERNPHSLELVGDAEVAVQFAGPSRRPTVLFELAAQIARLDEQLARLSQVEAQLGVRIAEVSRIDLGFESQAVVTFRSN